MCVRTYIRTSVQQYIVLVHSYNDTSYRYVRTAVHEYGRTHVCQYIRTCIPSYEDTGMYP